MIVTHTNTHTRELILIVSNVGPSSVGLVHTWDPIELCWRVTYTILYLLGLADKA